MKRKDFLKNLLLPLIPSKAEPIEPCALGTFKDNHFAATYNHHHVIDLGDSGYCMRLKTPGHYILRVGHHYTFTIKGGQGNRIHWKFVDSETGHKVAAGAYPKRSKSYVIHMTTVERLYRPMNSYDIIITQEYPDGRKIELHFRRAVTVLPGPFKEEDAYSVWEFEPGNGYRKINNLIDRSGYKVYTSGRVS